MAKSNFPGSKPNYPSDPVEGGGPMSDRAVRGNRDLNMMAGEEDRPRGRALEARQRNIEGHDAMTAKTEKEIRLRKLKAAADKPGASTYAKDRYRMARESGMYAKGGKVGSASKRADGCAAKGKTKGRFV